MAKGGPTRARTTERLLRAGLDVLTSKGFHQTTISDVCNAAEVSRGAFYSNFTDKESLFLALFDRHAHLQLTRIREAVLAADASDNIGDAIIASLLTMADERRWALLSAEFTVHAGRDSTIAQRLLEHDHKVIDELTSLLVRMSATCPDMASNASPRLRTLARATLAVYEGAMAQCIVDPEVDPRTILAVTLPLIVEQVPGVD